MCNYRTKRGSTYYFRRVIPVELRPAFDGKSEFMFSLGTKDPHEASAQVRRHSVKIDELLLEARANLAARVEQAPGELPTGRGDRSKLEGVEAQSGATSVDTALVREELAHIGFPTDDELAARLLETPDDELSPREQWMKRLYTDREFRLATLEERVGKYKRRWLASHNKGNAGDESQASPEPKNQRGVTAQAVMLNTSVVDRWATERKPKAKTIDAHRAVANWFYDRAGSLPVAEIQRSQVIEFKDKLLSEGQSGQNVNTKLSRLRTLFEWACDNDLMASNPARGITVKGAAGSPNKRLPFDLADLQAIVGSPVFKDGQRPAGGRGEAAFWLPVLSLYTAGRREELGQLRPSDIERLTYSDAAGKSQEHWFIRITETDDDDEQATQLKNEASERLVPVHPELERLGFIAYVDAVREQGHPRLFPLLRPGAYDGLTGKWGEWFSRYRREVCGITNRRKVFHSFRHAWKDIARHCMIEEGIQRQIMGHSGDDVADDYGSGFSLYRLVDAMDRFQIVGLSVHRPAGTA
jgi:hypothetical protein